MSGVNITILEGGKAGSFGQVTKLKTSNGSGSDLWVPKTDVETKHLSVKKNGLHYTNQYQPTASEKKEGKFHDVYGWDTITVSVKKKAKGKKRKTNPSTGIEYDAPTSVEVDDDGNLIETELPTSIEIITPPDKLEYRDGESVSKNGMVVKAYYADDSEWGIVPNNEISLDPTHATYSGGAGSKSSPLDTSPQVQPLPVNSYFRIGSKSTVEGENYDYDIDGANIFACYTSSNVDKWVAVVVASDNPNTLCFSRQYRYGNLHSTSQIVLSSSYTYNGKTVYYYYDYNWRFVYGGGGVQVGRISDYVGINKPANIAWTIVYGEASTDSETITVGWTPDEDEEELTDTFDITVTP